MRMNLMDFEKIKQIKIDMMKKSSKRLMIKLLKKELSLTRKSRNK